MHNYLLVKRICKNKMNFDVFRKDARTHTNGGIVYMKTVSSLL